MISDTERNCCQCLPHCFQIVLTFSRELFSYTLILTIRIFSFVWSVKHTVALIFLRSVYDCLKLIPVPTYHCWCLRPFDKKESRFTIINYTCLDSLWPSNTIWWHGPGLTFAVVMACCLTHQAITWAKWLINHQGGIVTFTWWQYFTRNGQYPGLALGSCDFKSHFGEIWKFCHYWPKNNIK